MASGIYCIRNKNTDKIYIGSAVDFNKRWIVHRHDLRKNKHHSKKLQNSFNKHGESAFEFSVWIRCPREYLLKMEQWCIDKLNPEYNVCKSVTSGMLGLKLTKEHCMAISKANTGKKCSEETKQKLREHNLGTSLSEEIKEKMRNRKSNHAVDAYDLDGKMVGTYRSIREASRQKNLSNATIQKCIAGTYKLAGGLIWKRHGESFDKTEIHERTNHTNKKRRVIQEQNGVILAVHDSIQEAARTTGFNPRKICYCCKGEIKNYKSCTWRYE